MKKVLLAACLCLFASKSMALGFGQSCRFTCTSALAQKALPQILEAGGDPSGNATFLDCAKSCKFSAVKNMWYTFLANALYQTARSEIEKAADVDSTLSKLGGDNIAKGLSYEKFVQHFGRELLTNIPAPGNQEIKNRKSSYMGGELLNNLHPDEFEKAVKTSTPVKKYLNHSNPRHKKAGENLVNVIVKNKNSMFEKILSAFESMADKRFGQNISVSRKEILRDFQKQSEAEKALGAPKKSKGAWYSILPIRSCARNCSTLQQGQKAGEEFTKETIDESKDGKNTLLYWCQQNCSPDNYGAFFCGAYDNISRDKKDFKVNNEKALNNLNRTKNRIYVTKRNREYVEKCINLFSKYGVAAKANDRGSVFAYNMTILAQQAENFDKESVTKLKAETEARSSEEMAETDDEDEFIDTADFVDEDHRDDEDTEDLDDLDPDELLAEYDE